MAIGLAAAGGLYLLIDQTIRAPDWLQSRIEERIEQGTNGLQVTFSDVEFVLGEGWRPRLRLRNFALVRPDGQPVVQLSNAEASLAMRPLLRGQVQPKRIYLTGALATLRRNADGRFEFLFDEAAPLHSAASLPLLLDQWERMLDLPQFSALTVVELQSITLRYDDLFNKRSWTLDGGRVRLDRDGANVAVTSSFALLGGGDVASIVEAGYASRVGSPELTFGITVRDVPAPDVAVQAPALNWLGVLRAPISGALRGSVNDDGSLGPLSATLQIGAGVLQPNDSARPIPFDGAHSYFTYTPDQQMLEFNDLSISSAWGSGQAEGRAYLGDIASGKLDEMIGQFTFSNLSLSPGRLYPEPLQIGSVTADLRLKLNPFELDFGQIQLDIGDSKMLAKGTFDAGPGGWSLSVDGNLDQMTPERLVELWPEAAAPKPREWVEENISDGLLRDIAVALRMKPGEKPEIFADFQFQDAQIQFLPTMPPITGAAGQATLVGNRFVVTAGAGRVEGDEGGAIDVTGTSFIIPDISIRQAAPGIVRFTGEGSITSILSLLNRPPLSVLKDTPLPVALADGQVRATGTVSMPLTKGVPLDEIEFHFNGVSGPVVSTELVPGYTVTSDRLRIEGDQTYVRVFGPGRIGEVPAEVSWRQAIGKGASKDSRVEGTVELSQTTVDTFHIGLPTGTVSGSGKGRFTLDLRPGKPPELALESELEGVRLRAPEIGWTKPAENKGLLRLTATLTEPARVDSLVVQGGGLKSSGSVTIKPDGGLDRALFGSVQIGNWFNGQVELIGRGAAAPAVRVRSGRLDLRTADFGSGSAGGSGSGSGPIDIALDTLQITDSISLAGFSGSFTTARGLTGDFRGRVNGQTGVTGQVVPQNGGSAFRIRSNDAGGVFRSAGLLRQGRGGDFSLTLLPADQAGQFDGTLRVTDTRVKDAPAIAALLNSISVIGLVDELTGQGIQFTEVDAKFRLAPSRLTLYSSSAVGPSMGISMDGTYNVPTGQLDMQGVISPIYMLNAIGSVLTRKGEGLIGFNYRLRGTASDPSVSVNPLSALAPGMFREIFRAPPPQDPNKPARPQTPPASSAAPPDAGR